jgi:hypothetical protein
MPTDPAATPGLEIPIKAGVSDDFSPRKLDRRISVASMMDWIDEANPFNKIINLGAAKMACLLYVPSRIGFWVSNLLRAL